MTVAEKFNEINRLKRELDSLHLSPKWDEAFLESVKIDFTYNSNKIEGSKLTYGQTLQLLRDLVTPRNVAPADMMDAINHKKVLDIIFADYNAGKISEERIKFLHSTLMKDIDQWNDYAQYSPGRYKTFENTLSANQVKFIPICIPTKSQVRCQN
jgi:Fic family protein